MAHLGGESPPSVCRANVTGSSPGLHTIFYQNNLPCTELVRSLVRLHIKSPRISMSYGDGQGKEKRPV